MTRHQHKIIITCAITGAIHTPSMSPYLPITPDDVAQRAIAAASAGAAILHLHARDPVSGRPSSDPAIFRQFVPRIAAETDAIINITTGGSTRMSLDERLAYPRLAKPELCSLNMGSMNFSIHPVAQKIAVWKHDWERDYVEGMEDVVFKNTFRDIEYILTVMGREHLTRFEFECYDVGHLYNLAYFLNKGSIQPPLFIQMVFGVLGGIGAEAENLTLMRSTGDRLFGRENYVFSVLGAGRHQMPFATLGAIMGGNVRVGLEDNVFLRPGELATSNSVQVNKIKKCFERAIL